MNWEKVIVELHQQANQHGNTGRSLMKLSGQHETVKHHSLIEGILGALSYALKAGLEPVNINSTFGHNWGCACPSCTAAFEAECQARSVTKTGRQIADNLKNAFDTAHTFKVNRMKEALGVVREANRNSDIPGYGHKTQEVKHNEMQDVQNQMRGTFIDICPCNSCVNRRAADNHSDKQPEQPEIKQPKRKFNLVSAYNAFLKSNNLAPGETDAEIITNYNRMIASIEFEKGNYKPAQIEPLPVGWTLEFDNNEIGIYTTKPMVPEGATRQPKPVYYK